MLQKRWFTRLSRIYQQSALKRQNVLQNLSRNQRRMRLHC